jgi:hypothetical protein
MKRLPFFILLFSVFFSGCVHDRWMTSEFTVPAEKDRNKYAIAKKDCIEKTEKSTSKAQIILTGAIVYNIQMGKLYQSCMEGRGFPCTNDQCYY